MGHTRLPWSWQEVVSSENPVWVALRPGLLKKKKTPCLYDKEAPVLEVVVETPPEVPDFDLPALEEGPGEIPCGEPLDSAVNETAPPS